MSFAEPEAGSSPSLYDKVLYSAECEKWASDFAHAYYALVKGEADLGDLMEWGYELWPQRMQESALHVARQWFDALPNEVRPRYLAGGKA